MPRRFPILAVIGTRPEAIKTAPLIAALRESPDFAVSVCATGQHKQLLDPMLRALKLRPDHALRLMRPDQSPSALLSRVIKAVDGVLKRAKPGLVLVQGDTTSALGAALAAFYRRIPVAHIEAGLRSFDQACPFPEEINRTLVDQLSALLFAPTSGSRRNLLREGVEGKRVFVTGNTGIDALLWAAARPHKLKDRRILRHIQGRRFALVTLHRRESFGPKLRELLLGLKAAARRHPELVWLYPVHPNPKVRRAARALARHPRILLCPPLGYLDFVALLKRCEFVVTDSGGIQEEAPALGKRALILRERTERAECLAPGTNVLAGVSKRGLLRGVDAICAARGPAPRRSPVGDGRASARIVEALRCWLGRSRVRPREFAVRAPAAL